MTLTYNEVTVTNLRIHYTVVIEKLVNVTKQCSDVHYIVFTVYIYVIVNLCSEQYCLKFAPNGKLLEQSLHIHII